MNRETKQKEEDMENKERASNTLGITSINLKKNQYRSIKNKYRRCQKEYRRMKKRCRKNDILPTLICKHTRNVHEFTRRFAKILKDGYEQVQKCLYKEHPQTALSRDRDGVRISNLPGTLEVESLSKFVISFYKHFEKLEKLKTRGSDRYYKLKKKWREDERRIKIKSSNKEDAVRFAEGVSQLLTGVGYECVVDSNIIKDNEAVVVKISV